MTSLDTERLLYRSQFILGPYFIEKFKSWNKINISDVTHLTVHPDLHTYQVAGKKKSITLLGYILDPNNPQDGDSDIINKLFHEIFNDTANYFKQTYNFGGRWILIVDDGEEIRLFTDPAGVRQVVYTDKNYTKDFWCASQPGTIAEILNLKMDNDAVNFINSFKRKNDEYYWPGDSSPYKEIKHLLPNHYLELKEGSYHRYWPDKAFNRISFDQAIEKCSHYLEGLMISASKRYNLILSLSSGWDSRLLLASCKKIKNKCSYLTEIKDGMTKNHPEVAIPNRLLSKWNLKHDILAFPAEIINDDFKKMFYKNVPFAHHKWALKAEAYFNYYNFNNVDVVGTVSDIAKCFYYKKVSNNNKITSLELSKLLGVENDKFALSYLNKWIMGIGEIYNYNVLDLFYWEQRAGRWVATNALEFDVGRQDIFIPYNCRTLLIDMLSVNEKFRKPPNYKLLNKMISNLWPEVLSEPINPHKKVSILNKFKRKLRILLQSILKGPTHK